MKTIKTIKDLKLKDGSTILKGTIIDFVRHGEFATVGIWNVGGVERKLRYRHVIKAPSIERMQKWDDDGICNTVFGERTEPDGYGPNGEPSWLLAMGMI